MADEEVTVSDAVGLEEVFGHREGEVKGPDPAKWGTLDERIADGAHIETHELIGQVLGAPDDLDPENLDQYVVKGPDPAEHP